MLLRGYEVMALKSYKPVINSMRGLVLVDRSSLYKGQPEKSLTTGLTKSGGRNNLGRMTVRHVGVVIKEGIERLISKEINLICLQ